MRRTACGCRHAHHAHGPVERVEFRRPIQCQRVHAVTVIHTQQQQRQPRVSTKAPHARGHTHTYRSVTRVDTFPPLRPPLPPSCPLVAAPTPCSAARSCTILMYCASASPCDVPRSWQREAREQGHDGGVSTAWELGKSHVASSYTPDPTHSTSHVQPPASSPACHRCSLPRWPACTAHTCTTPLQAYQCGRWASLSKQYGGTWGTHMVSFVALSTSGTPSSSCHGRRAHRVTPRARPTHPCRNR